MFSMYFLQVRSITVQRLTVLFMLSTKLWRQNHHGISTEFSHTKFSAVGITVVTSFTRKCYYIRWIRRFLSSFANM